MTKVFSSVSRFRLGYDPDEVKAFLGQNAIVKIETAGTSHDDGKLKYEWYFKDANASTFTTSGATRLMASDSVSTKDTRSDQVSARRVH